MKFTEECVMSPKKDVLVKKKFMNRVNMGFAPTSLSQKGNLKNFWAQQSREGLVDSLLGHERTHHY